MFGLSTVTLIDINLKLVYMRIYIGNPFCKLQKKTVIILGCTWALHWCTIEEPSKYIRIRLLIIYWFFSVKIPHLNKFSLASYCVHCKVIASTITVYSLRKPEDKHQALHSGRQGRISHSATLYRTRLLTSECGPVAVEESALVIAKYRYVSVVRGNV